jgi:hypothetical protein
MDMIILGIGLILGAIYVRRWIGRMRSETVAGVRDSQEDE